MKKILTSLVLILPLFLCACSREEQINFYEFIDMMNSDKSYTMEAEAFGITKGSLYGYSALINEHTMLCIYTDENGIIQRATITSDREMNAYDMKLCADCAEAITGAGGKEATAKALKNGSECNGKWLVQFIKSDIGCTCLISKAADEMHTNGKPTLKQEVREKDITRPTAAAEPDRTDTNTSTE